MAQTEFDSTKADPTWLFWSALALTLLSVGSGIWENLHPRPIANTIKWQTLANAARESNRSHKPVLYVFSAEWCGPCKQMESIAFAHKDIYSVINKRYVPVLVMDRMREEGKNPKDIEKVEKQCDVHAFPTLVVVPDNLLDGKTKDIYSTGNTIERQFLASGLPWPYNMEATSSEVGREFRADFGDEMLDMMHSRIPAHAGYGGPQDIRDYLFHCNLWHKLPPSRGKVNWKPLDQSDSTKQPMMLAFVEDCGYLSDKMRLRLFDDNESSAFINDNFAPSIVELKHSDANASGETTSLKNKYGIKALPALVVLNGDDEPVVEDGFTSSDHTLQFLKRALRSKDRHRS